MNSTLNKDCLRFSKQQSGHGREYRFGPSKNDTNHAHTQRLAIGSDISLRFNNK